MVDDAPRIAPPPSVDDVLSALTDQSRIGHVAFTAATRAQVDAFHAAALAAGTTTLPAFAQNAPIKIAGLVELSGTGATSVVLADLSGDGKLDLAVTNDITNTASVMLGNGDGTLQGAPQLAVFFPQHFILGLQQEQFVHLIADLHDIIHWP